MMETFRQIFREAMRLLRASTAMVGRLATAPFRALDDASELTARILARLFGPTPVEPDADVVDAIVDDCDLSLRDEDEEAYSGVGAYVRRAAEERLAHGVVVSPDIPPAIRSWVSVLSRESLRILIAAPDAEIGRHVAGEVAILDNIGSPIARPDPVKDEAIYRERLAERERRERGYDAAVRRPSPPDRAIAPSLVPVL